MKKFHLKQKINYQLVPASFTSFAKRAMYRSASGLGKSNKQFGIMN